MITWISSFLQYPEYTPYKYTLYTLSVSHVILMSIILCLSTLLGFSY